MATPNLKVGLFSIGLAAYWPQFQGLQERLTGYGAFVGKRLESLGAQIVDVGMVDDQPKAVAAGERFISENVDLVVCYVTTYSTSSQVIPAVQRVNRPVLILNLQPTAQLNYTNTNTGEWLANCQACCIPEIANAFNRSNIQFHTVTGLLGLAEQTEGALANEVTANHPAAQKAWEEIEQWLQATQALRTLQKSRIGFLGHTYPGMLDMYSDFTQHTGFLGTHIEILEMDDLQERVDAVTPSEIETIRTKTADMFSISEDSPSDPLAKKPDDESLDWAYRVAAGLNRLTTDFDLQGLTYYYRGLNDNANERLGAGLILGCSLLTAQSIPCSGEGDLKNCMAMKVMDSLGAGGSYTELYAMDFEDQLILMGHDGPFHIAIAQGKPILRGLGLYHGKRGSGISVEAHVKEGPITILGLTQTREGTLKWLTAQGWSLPGDIMRIGNTNSRIRFSPNPNDEFDVATWMNRWAEQGPTHHVALGVGHHANTLAKLAKLQNITCITM